MNLPKMVERDHAQMIYEEKIFATRNYIGDLEQRLALLESRKRKLGLGVEQCEISHDITDIKNKITNEEFVLHTFFELLNGHNPHETLIHPKEGAGACKKDLENRDLSRALRVADLVKTDAMMVKDAIQKTADENACSWSTIKSAWNYNHVIAKKLESMSASIDNKNKLAIDNRARNIAATLESQGFIPAPQNEDILFAAFGEKPPRGI